MSAVRMCDQCGGIFSERSDGWTAMEASRVKRGADGRRTVQTEIVDSCGPCSNGDNVPIPRVMIEGKGAAATPSVDAEVVSPA